jgi:hypothetical protein
MVERKPVLNISPEDLYNSTVHQPLRTDDSSPVNAQDRTDKINEEVFEGLLQDFSKNQTEGYFQSHPYDQVFTSKDLATDAWTLSNNYMRLIFGGRPNPKTDNIHMAYNHVIKQRAEAPTLKENTLYEMNPLEFVESKPATKESLLETFADQRMYWKGMIDSDTERALKQRPTHELIHTTYYGKDVTEGGQAGRFNFVTGQHGSLQFRPDTKNFFPYENLSSKTYAPMGNGKEVPLMYQNVYGDDPRRVPINHQPKINAPSPAATWNFNDTGSYPGSEVSRYLQNYVQSDPPFASLFRTSAQRRWV